MWQEIKVNNPGWEAPQLWCHQAVKVADQIVVFSIPKAMAQTDILLEYDAGAKRRDRRGRPEAQFGIIRGGGGPPSAGNTVNMLTYVLDCSQVFTSGCVAWKPPVNNNTAPPACALHSAVVCRGEILLFGGIQTSKNIDTYCIRDATNNFIVASPAILKTQ